MMKRTAIFTKASSETFRFPGPPRKLPFSTHSAQNTKKKRNQLPDTTLNEKPVSMETHFGLFSQSSSFCFGSFALGKKEIRVIKLNALKNRPLRFVSSRLFSPHFRCPSGHKFQLFHQVVKIIINSLLICRGIINACPEHAPVLD